MSREIAPRLLVITGGSGVGKDAVGRQILEKTSFKRLVTTADRTIREDDGEIEGIDYYFVSRGQFDQMLEDGEFAENVQTGSSRKGTTKRELEKVLAGEQLLWRIELVRASALDDFFDEQFDPETSQNLKNQTTVIFLGTAKLATQRNRALARGMTPEEFRIRHRDYELPIWKNNKDKFAAQGVPEGGVVKHFLIYNEDPKPGQTITDAISNVVDDIMQVIGANNP